jgi:oligopeptide/dipeptide ABC transporter ATP-binding protein
MNYEVYPGKTLAIVGESGSGKSSSSMGLMGLLAGNSRTSGSVEVKGVDMLSASPATVRKFRGKEVAYIFQEPMTALNPVYTIGFQIVETLRVHFTMNPNVAKERAIELITLVDIPNPSASFDKYPHQLSGGQKQRAMIAVALACDPALLIADEPTTALDVTVQAEILDLMRDLRTKLNSGILLITHDMGVVAGAADRVNVMYAGRIVESANVRDLYANPLMPYTQGLLASVPRMDRPHTNRLSAIPGQPPSMIALPSGCSFNPRCGRKDEVGANKCETQMPELTPRGIGHLSRCFIGEGA